MSAHSILSEKASDNFLIRVSTFAALIAQVHSGRGRGNSARNCSLNFRKFSVVKGIFPKISVISIFENFLSSYEKFLFTSTSRVSG